MKSGHSTRTRSSESDARKRGSAYSLLAMTDTPAEAAPPRYARSFVRRWVYPAIVILAIAGVIWWLESRDEGGVSSTGERYGPVALPEEMLADGVSVGAGTGEMAPDFLLETMEGREARLSDYRGQPVVLNFWATWCAPCRKEMPELVHAYDKYAEDGLVVIGLNQQESESIIRPFVEDYGVDFPVMIDRVGEVGDEFRTTGLPETFFIDRDGIVREHFIGPFESTDGGENVQGAIEQSELEALINEILGEDGDGSG